MSASTFPKLPREGVLYELANREALPGQERQLHRDACQCKGALDVCRQAKEERGAA